MTSLLARVWAARCMLLKFTGILFLALHLRSHAIQFEPVWALAYFGISLLSVPIYIWTNKLIARSRSEPHQIDEETKYIYEHVSETKENNPVCFWLAPAESAFFYVPLLYFGLNPINAAIAATMFGFMHYPQFLFRNCLYKVLVQYVLILLVLPHGILTMMAGHLLMDYVPLTLYKLLYGAEEQKEEKEPNNGLKSDAPERRAP
jgi:hypothetical protein